MSELTFFALAFPCGLFFRFLIFLARFFSSRLSAFYSVVLDFVLGIAGVFPLLFISFVFRDGVITFYPIALFLLASLFPVKIKRKNAKKSKTP